MLGSPGGGGGGLSADRERLHDIEVVIPLARAITVEHAPEEYLKVIQSAYVEQYLEALGVEPTQYRARTVLRHAPLGRCHIEAQWSEDSCVATELHIQQPILTSKHKQGARVSATRADLAQELMEMHEYINVSPPCVPLVGLRQQGRNRASGADTAQHLQKERDKALIEMHLHDLSASESANPKLTAELERSRKNVREAASGDQGPKLIQWGEAGEKSLEALKKKFILPFAALRPVWGTSGSRMVPWQSPELQRTREIQVPTDLLSEALKPVSVTLEEILREQVLYVHESLPLELLTTRRDPWLFAAIRERLCSPEFIRLTGLLTHLMYWIVFGHLHAPSRRLPQSSMQSLVLTVQELWNETVEPARQKLGRRGELLARDAQSGVCFVLPVFMLVQKQGVDAIFRMQYQKLFSDPDYGAMISDKFVVQLNIMMMSFFDPDCAYSNFGALDSSMEAIRLWRKHHVLQMKVGLTPATKTIDREHRTTPAVLLLMNADGGGPGSPKTRRMLAKCHSDSVLQAVGCTALGSPSSRPSASEEEPLRAPGSPSKSPTSPSKRRSLASPTSPSGPEKTPKPHLDQRKLAALYRTAWGKCSSCGLDSPDRAETRRNAVV